MSDISLYKPQVSLNQNFDIPDNLPENEKAFEIFKKLKLARLYQDALFLVIGKFLKITRDEKLYKYWDFDTFEQFIGSEEFSFSREKAYMTIRVYELYSERLHLSEKEIQEVGITRLSLMAPIVKKIEDDDIARDKVQEMKLLHYSEFVKSVKSEINLKGKPNVYWSEETQKWIVEYFDDNSYLISLGKFHD